MAPLRFLLLLLLASAGLAQEDVELDAADAEEPEVAKSAHLVIRKTVLPTVPVVGSPFEVKLEIFNAGNRCERRNISSPGPNLEPARTPGVLQTPRSSAAHARGWRCAHRTGLRLNPHPVPHASAPSGC